MAEGSSVDDVSIENGKQQLDGLNVTSEIVKEDEENSFLWESFLEDSIDRRAAKALNLPSVEELLPRRQLQARRRVLLNSSRPQSRAESLVGIIYSSMASDIRSAACSVSPSPNRIQSGRSSACSSFPGCGTTSPRKTTSTPRKSKTNGKTESIWSEALQQIGDMELLPHDDSLVSEPELDFDCQKNRNTMDILSAAGNLDKRRTAHGGYGTPSSYASEQEMNLYFDNSSVSELPFDSLGACHIPVDAGLQSIALLESKMKEEIIPSETNESIEIYEEQKVAEQCKVTNPAFQLDTNIEECKKESALTAAVQRCGDAVEQLEKLADSSPFYSKNELCEPASQQKNSSSSDIENFSFQNEYELRRRNSDSALNRKTTRKKKRKTRSKLPAKPENRLSKMLKSASESVIDRDMSEVMIYALTTPDISQLNSDGTDLSEFSSFQENLKELRSLVHARKYSEHHLNQETSQPLQSLKKDNFTELAVCQAQLNKSNLSVFDSFQACLKELRTFDHVEVKPAMHLKDEDESDTESVQSNDQVKTPEPIASVFTPPVYQSEREIVEVINPKVMQEDAVVESFTEVNWAERQKDIAEVSSSELNSKCGYDNVSSYDEDEDPMQTKLIENSGNPIVDYFENDCFEKEIATCKHVPIIASSNGSSFASKDAEEMSNSNHESPIYFERDQDSDTTMLTARRSSNNEATIEISLTNDFPDKNDFQGRITEENCFTLRSPSETTQTPSINDVYYHTNDVLPDEPFQPFRNSEKLLPNCDMESEEVFSGVEGIDMLTVNGAKTVHLKDPTSDVKYIDQAACDSGTESGYGTTNESKPKIKQGTALKYSCCEVTHCSSLSKNSSLVETKKTVQCIATPSFSTASVKSLPHQHLHEKEANSKTPTSVNVSSEYEDNKTRSTGVHFDTTKISDLITPDPPAVNQELSLFDVKASVLDSCLKSYEECTNPRLSNNAGQHVKPSFLTAAAKQEGKTINTTDQDASFVVSQPSTQTCINKIENSPKEISNTSDFCENSCNSSHAKKPPDFDTYGDLTMQTNLSKYSNYYALSTSHDNWASIENGSLTSQQIQDAANTSSREESKGSSQTISHDPSKNESCTTERIVTTYPDTTGSSKSPSLYIQPEVGTYKQHKDDKRGFKKLPSSKSVHEESKQNEYISCQKTPSIKAGGHIPRGTEKLHETVYQTMASLHQEKEQNAMEKYDVDLRKNSKLSTSAVYFPKRMPSQHQPKSNYILQQAFQDQVSPVADSSTQQTNDFTFEFRSKYKNLEEQIERILNPTPSPPLELSNPSSILISDYSDFEHNDAYSSRDKSEKTQRKVRFDVSDKTQAHSNESTPKDFIKASAKSMSPHNRIRASYSRRNTYSKDLNVSKEISSSLFVAPKESLSLSSSASNLSDLNSYERHSIEGFTWHEYGTIAETLQFVRENLNRDDDLVKKLESEIQSTCGRMLEMEERALHESLSDNQNMPSDSRTESGRPTKVRALEEVVNLLKKHVQQREIEINGLGGQLRHSNEKILLLEKKLKEKQHDEYWMKGVRQDKEKTLKKLQIMQAERDELKKRICSNQRQKEDAQKASRKARRDLDFEKENHQAYSCNGVRDCGIERKHTNTRHNDIDEKVDDLEYLNQSSSSDQDKKEDRQSFKRENRSSHFDNDQSVFDLKTDNTIMREKLDRMNEISAENLLLQSDAADYQAELAELRDEAKELRTRCYELNEENRQCKAEIRDLRRYIELLKSNKTGDSRQDLLNKIEYYQMEHDRLLDEVRRLKHRLGEVSPRSPRSPRARPISPSRPRAGSPKSSFHASYPGISTRNTTQNVRFSHSLERGRSPVSDAMAASSASSHAAVRLVKDRSLSPAAALNIRDLTMDRYHQHMDGPDSPRSMDSDSTEMLLKPQTNGNGCASMPSTIAPLHSDDDDDDVELDLPNTKNGKLSDSNGSTHGRLRSASKDSMCRSSCRRSCSPTNPGGFRSVSPRMTSTQKTVHDTARDRYPTKIKRSLPRRAFAPRSPADLMLGYSIKFTRPGGRLSRGSVKYIGHLPTRDEMFIGVELDGYDGKHSGTFQGTKYFTCPTNKGIFTPFSKVIMAWE